MKIFIRYVVAVCISVVGHIEPLFAQSGFTGLYNADTMVVVEGTVLTVLGELKIEEPVFNGGLMYVTGDVVNLNPSIDGFPNPVGSAILNGTADQKIIGNWNFNELRLDKPSGDVTLKHSIKVDSLLKFVQGNLYIDSFIVDLKNKGALANETNDNRVYATNGFVTTTRNLQELNKSIDVAGLGLFIEAPKAFWGTTTISRGHVVFPDAGAGSIARYFKITTTDDKPIDNIVLRYFETDNIKNEHLLQLYSSKSSSPIWFPKGGIVNELLDTISSPFYKKIGSEIITMAPASDNATCSPSNPNYVEAIYMAASHAYTLDTVAFVNFSYSRNDTSSLEYIWNFGDGGASNKEDAFHIYTEEGIYTTTLQVNNGLCSDFRKKYDTITVAPPSRLIGTSYGQILNVFKYYPNPCSNQLTIYAELSDEFPSSISIYDVMGRKLLETDYADKMIDDQVPVYEFSSGVYILEFQSMGKKFTYKLIKD